MTDKNLSISTGISTTSTELANIPVGTMMMYAGYNTIPSGWLECNGQSTTGYPALAAIVGATVPNLNARFIRGQDNATNTSSAGSNNTANTGTSVYPYFANTNLTASADLSHYHGTSYTGDNHQHNWSTNVGDSNPSNVARGGNNVVNSSGQSHNHTVYVGGATSGVYAWHNHGNVNYSLSTHEHVGIHTHSIGLTYLSFRYIIKY